MYYYLHPYWQMKCHSYQICVLDVNLSCPTHILFEPSHTAPFDACPTGNSSMGRQTVEVAPYSGAYRTCPYPSHIFPNFHQRVCTNSLHLPVLMLMPRHHLRALQKWQNTMTSAERLRAPVRLGWGGWPYAKKTISPGVQMIVQDSELINTSLSHKAANICKPWANISPYIPTSTTSTTKSPRAASHISSPIRPISPSHPLSWLSFQTVNPIENARSARLRWLPWIISQGHGLCK